MDPVIEVEHLGKRYGSTVAVADVSFAVQKGEIFGIFGPNGAGKTTTVECMEGLRSPDSGRVRVLGLFPMWLLSGSGPPPAVLTEGMRTVSDLLPLTCAVRALQDPWLGRPTDGADVIVLAGILIVAGALSVRLFRSS